MDRGALRILLRNLLKASTRVLKADPVGVDEVKGLVSSVNMDMLGEHLLPSVSSSRNMQQPVWATDLIMDNNIHVNLFGFRRKMDRIPLHDHPNIHGFVKVIRGSVKVNSFTLLDTSRVGYQLSHDVRYEGDIILTANDGCVSLGPSENNIHEIEALEDGTFFFDALYPGYRNEICTYFKAPMGPLDIGSVYRINETRSTFRCESYHYPKIPYYEVVEGIAS